MDNCPETRQVKRMNKVEKTCLYKTQVFQMQGFYHCCIGANNCPVFIDKRKKYILLLFMGFNNIFEGPPLLHIPYTLFRFLNSFVIAGYAPVYDARYKAKIIGFVQEIFCPPFIT